MKFSPHIFNIGPRVYTFEQALARAFVNEVPHSTFNHRGARWAYYWEGKFMQEATQ